MSSLLNTLEQHTRMTASTGRRTFYLGHGKGSSVIVPDESLEGPIAALYRAQRMAYIYDERGSVSLAVLSESARIPYKNMPEIAEVQLAVITEYPPGQTLRYIVAHAPEAYHLLQGETLDEKVINTLAFPAPSQLASMRASASITGSSKMIEVTDKGVYQTLSGLLYFWLGGAGSAYDASGDIPSTEGKHKIGILVIDTTTNTLKLRAAAEATSASTLPNRSAFTWSHILGISLFAGDIPIVAVYLYFNQLFITESDFYREYDLRFRLSPYQKHNLSATGAPTTGDDANDGYAISSMWINVSADTVYFCTDATVGAAVWKQVSNETATDEKAKVSSNDTTPGYLNGKLVAGSNITLTENNDAGNETLTIAASGAAADEKAKVSSNDTTSGYLNGKLVAGLNVTLTENNDAGNETLTIAASGAGGDSTTKQAFASRPAAGNDGNLAFSTDAITLERDNGSSWDSWGPLYPLTVPTDPGTWVNQGSATITLAKDVLTLYVPGNSGDLRLRVMTAPTPPYTWTVAFIPMHDPGNYSMLGLVWRASGDGKVQPWALTYNNGSVDAQTQNWSGTATANYVGTYRSFTPSNIPGAGGVVWLRLQDDNTNRKCLWSADGLNFIEIHSHARTTYFTPDQIGILGRANTVSPYFGGYMHVISMVQA